MPVSCATLCQAWRRCHLMVRCVRCAFVRNLTPNGLTVCVCKSVRSLGWLGEQFLLAFYRKKKMHFKPKSIPIVWHQFDCKLTMESTNFGTTDLSLMQSYIDHDREENTFIAQISENRSTIIIAIFFDPQRMKIFQLTKTKMATIRNECKQRPGWRGWCYVNAAMSLPCASCSILTKLRFFCSVQKVKPFFVRQLRWKITNAR